MLDVQVNEQETQFGKHPLTRDGRPIPQHIEKGCLLSLKLLGGWQLGIPSFCRSRNNFMTWQIGLPAPNMQGVRNFVLDPVYLLDGAEYSSTWPTQTSNNTAFWCSGAGHDFDNAVRFAGLDKISGSE